MKKLLIGLGNPGEEYTNSRHNAGANLVDHMAQHETRGWHVEKTGVYMNESGKDVRRLKDYYKVSNEDLYVAYDDLDIPLGSYKISKGKSPRVHNGINSVVEELGTEDFWHVRIGIDGRTEELKNERTLGRDYVLQDFSVEERKTLNEVLQKIVEDLSVRL